MDKMTMDEAEECFMRDNERLRQALQHYKAADDGVYQMLGGLKATKDMEDPDSIAGKALRYCNRPVQS